MAKVWPVEQARKSGVALHSLASARHSTSNSTALTKLASLAERQSTRRGEQSQDGGLRAGQAASDHNVIQNRLADQTVHSRMGQDGCLLMYDPLDENALGRGFECLVFMTNASKLSARTGHMRRNRVWR